MFQEFLKCLHKVTELGHNRSFASKSTLIGESRNKCTFVLFHELGHFHRAERALLSLKCYFSTKSGFKGYQ